MGDGSNVWSDEDAMILRERLWSVPSLCRDSMRIPSSGIRWGSDGDSVAVAKTMAVTLTVTVTVVNVFVCAGHERGTGSVFGS